MIRLTSSLPSPPAALLFLTSPANIPGTANGTLPDSTLHYVPFTYVGTVNASIIGKRSRQRYHSLRT